MTDEIQILGRSINEMTENIGILHAGLEQEIRERRTAEHALRASEHKFHQMAELLPQPVFEADVTRPHHLRQPLRVHDIRLWPRTSRCGHHALRCGRPRTNERRARDNFRRAVNGEEQIGWWST